MTKVTKLAAERRELMDDIAMLTKRKAEIDAKLLKLDPDKTYTGDGVELSFTRVHSLDSALIAKRFPASRRPEFYKLSLDVAECRKHFAEKDLEPYEKISTRINVKAVD